MAASPFEDPRAESACFLRSIACFAQSGATVSRTSARVARLAVTLRDCAMAGRCSLHTDVRPSGKGVLALQDFRMQQEDHPAQRTGKYVAWGMRRRHAVEMMQFVLGVGVSNLLQF